MTRQNPILLFLASTACSLVILRGAMAHAEDVLRPETAVMLSQTINPF